MSLCLFGLVSCAAEDPGTAVAYLDALNTRDLETARDLVCEARQDDVTMGLVTVDDVQVEPFEFTNVSCSSQGAMCYAGLPSGRPPNMMLSPVCLELTKRLPAK